MNKTKINQICKMNETNLNQFYNMNETKMNLFYNKNETKIIRFLRLENVASYRYAMRFMVTISTTNPWQWRICRFKQN